MFSQILQAFANIKIAKAIKDIIHIHATRISKSWRKKYKILLLYLRKKLHRGLLRLFVVAARPACCEELGTAASTFIGSIAVVGEGSCVSTNQSCRLQELSPPQKT